MATRTSVQAHVTRHFAASPERVFDAWLNCDMLERWMFGPAVRDEEIVHLSLDPRVGGSFSFLVERGEQQIEHLGRYLEIARPRRLVFTWMVADESVGSRVLIDIAAANGGSDLRLTHEMHSDWAAHVGATEAAWNRMFDALAIALE